MKVSIIVPAFNEGKLPGETLVKIKAAADMFTKLRWEIELIVCDNNSTDRTAEIARAAGATVIFKPIHLISRARNSGAAVANGDSLDGACSLLAVVIIQRVRTHEPAFRQRHAPLSAIRIPIGLAHRVVRHHVEDELFRAVVGELVRFTRRKDELFHARPRIPRSTWIGNPGSRYT